MADQNSYPLYPPTKLDERQIFQGAYDEAEQRIRTDAVATISNVSIEVDLDPSEDGVFIADKDTGDKLTVNPDGSINAVTIEVIQNAYIAGVINVSTSQIEAKVGATRLTGRVGVRVFNNSSDTIYFGPSGITTITGEPLFKNQAAWFPFGDIGLFLIATSPLTDIRIQEFA